MPDQKKYTDEELTQMVRDNVAKLPYALRKHIDINRIKAVNAQGQDPGEYTDKTKFKSDNPYTKNVIADVRNGSRDTIHIYDPDAFAAHPLQLTAHETTHLIQNGLPKDDYSKIPTDTAQGTYDYGGADALHAGMEKKANLLETQPFEKQAALAQYAVAQQEFEQHETPELRAAWEAKKPAYDYYVNQIGDWNQTGYNDPPIKGDNDPRLNNVKIPQQDLPPGGMMPPPEKPAKVINIDQGVFHAQQVYGYGDAEPGSFQGRYSPNYLQKVLGPIKFATPKGRPAQPAPPAPPAPPAQQNSVESILGPIKTAKLPPMVSSRLSLYSKARANGFNADKAAKVAMQTAATITPQSDIGQKVSLAVGSTKTGAQVESNVEDLGRMYHHAKAMFNSNPGGVSDAEWEADRKKQQAFFDKHIHNKFLAGAATGGAEFTEEMAYSPVQLSLVAATAGGGALGRMAWKAGAEWAVPAISTISKLIQLQFASQMVEGAASGLESTIKSSLNGDWEGAGKAAVEGLTSGVMAHGLMSHGAAEARVRSDLEKTAREKYGNPGEGLKAAITSKFDSLNPFQQGAVIDATVKASPEYQEILKSADEQGEQAKDRTKKQREKKLANYYGQALSQAWSPDAAARSIDRLQRNTERRERIAKETASQKDEESRQKSLSDIAGILKGHVQRKTEEASRAIAAGREQISQQRNAARDVNAEEPTRQIDASVGADGHVTYPANVWGEESSFGVSSDVGGHAIYRQTPRGAEWMNADGNFEEAPEDMHFSSDPATADTLARLSALNAHLDSAAEAEGATKEEKEDADKIAAVRRDLVAGEIDAKEAQKRAGIAEKVSLPDEYVAASDGKLNGPFHDQSHAAWQSQLEQQAREKGMSEEETRQIVEHQGVLARQATESNLHHVSQPGDYLVSKSGTTWTLDHKGLLHPADGGQPVPLMKRGLYSTEAMNLAESGRVGYGSQTRDERRADAKRGLEIVDEIMSKREEMNKAMRLAQQREGLETAAPDEPRADFGEKQSRRERFMSRPPRAPESAVGKIVRLIFKAPADSNGVIHSLAEKKGVPDEEIMRLALASDPERANTVEAKVANLEVGDQISDDFRKDRPWKVEQGKDGQLFIRSGQATKMKLDRLNPSDRVRQIVKRGTVTSDKPEFSGDDVQRAAYDRPHYVRWQEGQVQEVKDRTEGKQKDPEPRSPEQAAGQVQNATRRSAATESVAAKAINETINPQTDSAEKAEQNAEKATEQIKVAEQAYAQEVEAQSKTVPQGDFPQRAPASVGLLGVQGVVVQNSREIPFHYELLPLEGILTSHTWNGSTMEVNPEYPGELQPRTISEAESKSNAMRAERGTYDFRQYADSTITGSTGPAIVDQGGRAVGGNTRLAILRKHIENLKSIADPEEREAAMDGLRLAMRKVANEAGITSFPDDGQMYAVTRMMEKPIETRQEAAELGRLFNKSVSVQMGQDARGVSYANSLDDRTLEEIARRVDAHDGIAAAISADPQYFTDLIRNRFDVDQTENANWFEKNKDGVDILHELGRNQFVKTMLGTVIKDSSVLSRLKETEDSSYRAVQRGLGYLIKMRALPDFDISDLVQQALNASVDTAITDPELALSKDKWAATYHPDQQNLVGMELDLVPEPNRIVEVLWRALHASSAAVPRIFNDRLKDYLGEETSKAGWLMEEHTETPREAFNRAFAPEIKLVQHSRGDAERGISQVEWDARDRELSDQEREGVQEPEAPKVEISTISDKKGPMEAPPEPPSPAATADKKLAVEKKQRGYVTPQQLRVFLDSHPATREHAAELYRTADMMARFVLESDPHEGVDKKDALAWVLKERVAGIEAGELKSKRGQYSDPNLEKKLGTGIMKLHQAADASTFIHEFAHVIFPLLSDEDIRLIDTIHGPKDKAGDLKYPLWDGTRKGMDSKTYTGLSEKFAHGLEQFLRDENPTGFKGEVKAVLAKVKSIMRKVYMAFTGDPLSDYQNTEESREVFAKMFGIEDFDVQDKWRDEVKKARAEEKRMKKPSEEPHPIVAIAKDMGATGIKKSIEGKVEDSIGERVDPKKPVAVVTFGDNDTAVSAWKNLERNKIENAELIKTPDDKMGIRFNTKTKVPPDVLYQDVPEKHPALRLEELESRLRSLPAHKMMERRLLELQVENLKNKIRAQYGAENLDQKSDPEVAQQALEEKNGKTNSTRAANNGVSGVQDLRRAGGIPKPPQYRVSGNAGAGQRGVAGGRPVAREGQSLAEVKPVNLEPLRQERAAPVGVTHGEPFDNKAWVDGLKRAGLPENAPAPTWALNPKTAEQLIFPGQKQVVQLALSALEQGDGAVIATATGSGKTYTAMAAVKEWRMRNPDAKILVITKNSGLLKSGKEVAAETFGFHLESDIPDSIDKGVFGTTYQRMLNNKMLGDQKWDLVVADESGEARRWYADDNKQGKALKSLIENSQKAIYLSATPFHSPMEYGYLDKLNLWPKGQFDKWIEQNFAHEKINDKIVAKLDPSKQAKLRQQLIERGQLVSQAISYDGYTAHFGVVPVTDGMKRSLDRIHEGFARARSQFISMGKKGMAEKAAAFEATYTKSFLERARIPEAIELARKAREQGWQVLMFSETSADDLFRRERVEGADPSTYQQLDDAMGGQLSKIIPPFANVYEDLRKEFGEDIADYSGRGNTMASRDKAKSDFMSGKAPMLYTTYAAGGIGVSLHDTDGDKPRVAIFLGPPYSGVLLEQAMGRTWRFGVKSDTHAVFLATDSEPDIRLMQQKVGPRMRALRAAVLGEKDSLASAMASYTSDEKVLARQNALAYAEGDEVRVNAANFTVRSKSRNVGINDWSTIQFPTAESAKNKGMKYGEEVTGGNWSTLYQEKFGMRPPDTPEEAKAKNVIDEIGNKAVEGKDLPPEAQRLDPADRKTVVGLAAATATEDVESPVERDKTNVARQAMESGLRTMPSLPYYGLVISQELGMKSIARQAGVPEAGDNLLRMHRSAGADYDRFRTGYWNMLEDILKQNKLKPTDDVMKELSYVIEGKRTSANDAITRAAADISDMMRIAHGDMAKAGVRVTLKDGTRVPYSTFGEDAHYFPHRIDWDHKVEDPQTGEKVSLRDMMKPKFDELARKRILESIPELKPYSYQQVLDYLDRNDPRATVLSNIHRAREVNFPFIKRDYQTLIGYFDQVSLGVAQATNYGPDLEKVNAEIHKIKNVSGQATLKSMFRSVTQPQSWNDTTSKIYNAAIAYEAASKMTFSAFKVPFHLGLVPLGMEGRVVPLAKAMVNFALHPKETMENAAYVGSLTRQLNAADMMYGEHASPLVRKILRKEMFESAYKMIRTITNESARVYLDQYAMKDLKKDGPGAGHTRRLLRDTFLIGDGAIDDAVHAGRFSQDDMARAQTGFTNMVTFTNDPLQMPKLARMEISQTMSREEIALKRAVRLTYALQSFSLKATSLLREKLFDEVVLHGNYRPLAYALVASPILGQMLQATSTGVKHVVHKGLEGLEGKQHKEDSWDKYLKSMEETYEHPEAARLLKFIVDGYTLGYGWDTVRTVTAPFLAMAAGDATKAKNGFEYMGDDLLEHLVGGFFTDIGKTIGEIGTLGVIHEGKAHPELRGAKERRSVTKYLADQVPALRNIPQVEEETAPHKKQARHYY